jgi:hypothetical protein
LKPLLRKQRAKFPADKAPKVRVTGNNPMKTKSPTVNSLLRFFLPSLIAAALMATVIAPITAVAVPGDLYVGTFDSNTNSGVIVQITPGGTQSNFASAPGEQTFGLAFDKSNNLFVGATNIFVAGGTILKYTPGGTQTTFATGLTEPRGLAFDSAGNLFKADKTSGNIYEFTFGGVRSTLRLAYSSL